MQLKAKPSHVALLVPSVRKAADYLKQFHFQIGESQDWEGEGTCETYVEREKNNSLLLIEPISSGPYQKAIEKRGPGLHHLAIDVSHLEEYIESLAGSGWLLHPLSIKTIKQIQIAYLARPGFPSLIEVQQKENWNECENINNLFITEVFAPMDTKFLPLIQSLNLETVVKPSTNGLQFTMGGHTITMQDLL